MDILRIPSLVAVVIWVARAAVVYWRLRGSSMMQAEMEDTRRWICLTPPMCYFAPILIPALPVIVDMTCVINALLWPVEQAIRPWRTGGNGPQDA